MSGLMPATDVDAEKKQKLKYGQAYQFEVKQIRNYEFHKKYFALIETAWQMLNEKQEAFFGKNKETFRKTLQVTAGYADKVFNFNLKEWVDVPKSISFSSMDELEFQELYNAVLDVILQSVLKSITKEEFEKHLLNFL